MNRRPATPEGVCVETVFDLLNTLATRGVKLSVEGDQLNCFAQKGTLTDELELGIMKYKPQIIGLLRNRARPAAEALPSAGVRRPPQKFPLSTGQRTHYFLQKLNPDRSYAVPICLRIGVALSPELLQRAWQCLLERHPLLTARIVDEAGTLHQIVDGVPNSTLRVQPYDTTDERQLLRELQEKILQPFDLATGPLARIDLLTRDGADSILLIVVHHIVFDGYSVGILLRSLFDFYRTLIEGRPVDATPRPSRFESFVAWEARMLASDAAREHARYWREQLQGELPRLKLLPDAGSGTPGKVEEPQVCIAKLPREVVDWVRSYSRSQVLQPSVLFLGAFQLLLYKYTQQDDLMVVMPTMVRPLEELTEEVGYFFNIVPLRTKVSGSLPLERLMRDVQGTLLDGLFHSDYPFSLMLDGQRKAEANAAFKVFFAFQNAVGRSDSATRTLQRQLDLRPLEGFHQKAEGDFELALEIYEDGADGFRAHLQGDPRLYSNEVLATLLDHYLALLSDIARDPERQVAQFSIASALERQKVLCTWNDTAADYPKRKCTHQLFREQVAAHPDRVAVAYRDERLTYRELESKCDALALYLQSHGLVPDQAVCLCLERSLEMMVGILGTVMGGGAYLPIDPDYPDDRLSYMLQDSGARVVLTQEKFVRRLQSLLAPGMTLLALDTQWAQVDGVARAGGVLRDDVTPDNVNYVIYTSGSTGKPKGVLVEHRALVNRINWMQKRYPLSERDVVLQKTPYSFDVSVWEFFWPVMFGSSLVFAEPAGHTDVQYLEKLIADAGVTTLHYVPSMLHVFLDNCRAPCRGVRQIFCSGEALDRRCVERYGATFPNAALHNLYGPTEAAIDVTAYDCSRLDRPFVPIGAPIDNIRIYILDEGANPQPEGVPGELYIAGDGLARGYLNRPELTREKFVANPFTPGTRMYKTGDLARWMEDGTIQYLGRIDVQVKIGGVRIETGEIESHLNRHPRIAASAVTARGEVGYKQLIAFYVARDTQDGSAAGLTHQELREHLTRTLPEYMVPAAFVAVPAIPLSTNGKVDRRALDRIEVAVAASQKYVAPRNPLERQLVDLWAEIFKEHGFVLEQTRIGVHDDFFELGGSSLLATQLIYKIRWHLGVELPVRVLFEHTNVARLAELIAGLESQGTPPEEPVVDLAAEAVLDPDIQPGAAAAGVDFDDGQSILLTGATGFLGAYLLRELIAATAAPIQCLVRCRTESDGARRIKLNLQKYGLWSDALAARIVPVPGDLAKPLLGLGERAFQALADNVDTLFHNGAWVNFIYPYGTLKNANVGGTEEVLRLAARGRRKPLHFVSTGSVFAPRADRAVKVLESEPPQDWQGIRGGYAQSKWTAERLVTIAAQRGLPVRIYRPGTVSGDSVTGYCNTADFIPRMIKGCIQLGVAPDTDAMIGFVPVDYVTRAIVHLARQRRLSATVFHVSNPEYIPAARLGTIFGALGHELKVVPYRQWREALLADARHSTRNELFPLLPLFTAETPLEREPRFDCRNTLAGLQGTPIECPPIDAKLLGTYLDYFKRSGFLA